MTFLFSMVALRFSIDFQGVFDFVFGFYGVLGLFLNILCHVLASLKGLAEITFDADIDRPTNAGVLSFNNWNKQDFFFSSFAFGRVDGLG